MPNGEFVYLSYDYDSSLVVEDYLTPGDRRLLEVDNPVIVPVNTTLRFRLLQPMCCILELYPS